MPASQTLSTRHSISQALARAYLLAQGPALILAKSFVKGSTRASENVRRPSVLCAKDPARLTIVCPVFVHAQDASRRIKAWFESSDRTGL